MSINFLNNLDYLFLFFFIILAIFLITIFFAIKKNKYEKWYINLLSVRVLIYIVFLILILNPVISFIFSNTKELKLGVYIDNSSSMKFHQYPSFSSIKSGLDDIFEKFNERNIPYEIFLFDNNIRSIKNVNVDGDGLTTNLAIVANSIEKKDDLFSALLITDGIATEGRSPFNSFDKLNIPINIIGIGKNSEMVDISIHSIDAPTVVLNNDNVNVKAIIKSNGDIKKRIAISLYQDNSLLGSKDIQVSGKNSFIEVDFLFNVKKIGNQKFQIRASSLEDEVNVLNNRESFNILVLKNKYKVALITGSPNKNTSLIKNYLNANKRVDFDHYIKITDSEFRPSIKSFWSMPYELIILENFPIIKQSDNFIRIFGKKIVAHNSSIFMIAGPNQTSSALTGFSDFFGTKIINQPSDSIRHDWQFVNYKEFDFMPPLINSFLISGNSKSSDTLAIFDNQYPLWIKNQNNKIRSAFFTSPELSKLQLRFLDYDIKPADIIMNNTISWLLQISGSKESFYRLNKKRYQLGEIVSITGNRLSKSENNDQRLILRIFNQNREVENKEFRFNVDLKRWEGDYRPSISGIFNYQIYFDSENNIIQSGNFEVLESRIELSNVFLNENLLNKISINSFGQFKAWDERSKIVENINPLIKKEEKTIYAKFNESLYLLIFIISLFSFEWYFRKQKGLL